MEISASLSETPWLDLYRREAIAIGNQALRQAFEEEDIYGIRHFKQGSVSVVAARVLLNLSETTMDIKEKTCDVLTTKGAMHFMVHQNKLLGGYTPLEFCAVGGKSLAVEAGKCFYDPEYVGDINREDFDPRLERAIESLEQIYSI